MKRITYGTVPDELLISMPYRMVVSVEDARTVAEIVNQGIDSHLEAVFTRQSGREVWIEDDASMHTFLRRCVESGSEDAALLASDILFTLGFEWE